MKNYIFTLTQGRTGTMYLKELFKQNFDFPAYHERLSFGLQTPEISHILTFNTVGNTKYIKQFWTRKLGLIYYETKKWYAETSHILAKAGLFENLADTRDIKPKVVILKRDPFQVVRSLHKRGDFLNMGNMWLWWLSPDYPKNIVKFKGYLRHCPVRKQTREIITHYGVRLWYIHEMTARAEYYKIMFGDKIDFIEVNLDDLNDKEKVKKFFKELGLKNDDPIIPKKQNLNQNVLSFGEIEEKIYRNLIDKTTPDYQKVIKEKCMKL